MKKQTDKYTEKIQTRQKVWTFRIVIGVVVLLILVAPEIAFSQNRKPPQKVPFVSITNPAHSRYSAAFIKRWDDSLDKEYHINERCESYRPQVEEIAEKYDMSEYVDLILAVMMQESSGRGTDIMQASEGEHNKAYPRVPDGITDTTYSITCGIQDLKHVLEKAGVTGPNDLMNIELALQGYNFGYAYIDYAKEEGDSYWDKETAAAFAEKYSGGRTRDESDAKNMGKWQYGDQFYPQHVLRYYPPYAELFTKEYKAKK